MAVFDRSWIGGRFWPEISFDDSSDSFGLFLFSVGGIGF